MSKVKTLSKKQSNLIRSCLLDSRSYAYWGTQLRDEYLRYLRSLNPDIPGYRKETFEQNIFEWIKDLDGKLEEFEKLNFRAERDRAQVSKISKLTDSLPSIRAHLEKKFEPMGYDIFKAGRPGNPELVYSQITGDTYEYWFAERLARHYSEELDLTDLDESLIEEIESKFAEKHPDYSKIEELRATISTASRVLYKVFIGIQDGTIEFSTDQPALYSPDDDDNPRLRPEDRLIPFIETAFEKMELSPALPDSDKFYAELQENQQIDRDTIDNIRHQETDELIVLPIVMSRRTIGGGPNEDNRNRLQDANRSKVQRALREYYESKTTLRGFLRENPQFDIDQGHIQQNLNSDNQVQPYGVGFLIGLITGNGQVEVSLVQVNTALSSIKISYHKGGIANDRIRSEVDRIFSGS